MGIEPVAGLVPAMARVLRLCWRGCHNKGKTGELAENGHEREAPHGIELSRND
jgi:hypothetical protein